MRQETLYSVLEDKLRKAKHPITCNDLVDDPKVKQFDEADPKRISDYLGHMWRRDLLNRHQAPKTATSIARYAYSWKGPSQEYSAPIERKTAGEPAKQGARRGKSKINFYMENDVLNIEVDDVVITVTKK